MQAARPCRYSWSAARSAYGAARRSTSRCRRRAARSRRAIVPYAIGLGCPSLAHSFADGRKLPHPTMRSARTRGTLARRARRWSSATARARARTLPRRTWWPRSGTGTRWRARARPPRRPRAAPLRSRCRPAPLCSRSVRVAATPSAARPIRRPTHARARVVRPSQGIAAAATTVILLLTRDLPPQLSVAQLVRGVSALRGAPRVLVDAAPGQHATLDYVRLPPFHHAAWAIMGRRGTRKGVADARHSAQARRLAPFADVTPSLLGALAAVLALVRCAVLRSWRTPG